MSNLWNLLNDAEQVLALEPEDLAGLLLEMLGSLPPDRSYISKRSIGSLNTNGIANFPQQYHGALQNALMEAWAWLESEGMVVPAPESDSIYFISRRGRKARNRAGIDAYRRASLLPRKLLHPSIAQKVAATFLQGDYDTSIFQAFKEVEVAVRKAGDFADSDLGVNLMRKAFGKDGPLTDKSAIGAEQEALASLFAGAIGSYKNPSSHRSVAIDVAQAVSMLMLASHLLGVVDTRTPVRSPGQ